MSTAKKKKKRKLQVVTEEVKVREDRRKRQYQFWKDRVDNAQQRLCDDEFQLFGPEEEDIPSQFKKRTLVHNLYLTVATGRHQTSLQYVKTIRKQQYRKFRHRADIDSFNSEVKNFENLFLKRRSQVLEVVSGGDLVFAVTETGACSAYFRKASTSLEHLCYLNVLPNEIIRSIFFNQVNNSVITVGVSSVNNFGTLRCRSTTLAHIKESKPELGTALLTSESLKWPGFVEFDDVNKKILTFSSVGGVYKLWDLCTYELLFEVKGSHIDEIKISPGIMLLIYDLINGASHLKLQIMDIETGNVLNTLKHTLFPVAKIEILEQFNSKLLIKQTGHPLQIVDVIQVNFQAPSAFIFLFEHDLFLTFYQREVLAWNMRGEVVTRFADHTLMDQHSDTSTVCLNSAQDVIISFCSDPSGPSQLGSINISNIFSGELLGKVDYDSVMNSQRLTSYDQNTSRQALAGVTCLVYNEQSHHIYTGHEDGTVHVWSC